MNQLSGWDYYLKKFSGLLCTCNNKISLKYENVNSTNIRIFPTLHLNMISSVEVIHYFLPGFL